MAQSDALPATAAWQADEMMAVASMDLDMLPELHDLDASLSELSQSGWSIQQDVRQSGEPLDLLNIPSRGLIQDLQDLNWLQELSSSPSAPSDAPFPLFLQQQQLEPASQSTAWQPSFPAATTSRTREPALLQPSFPAPAASLALRAQDLSIPSQAQQPGFPAAATSLLFQPRPITNPMQAQSSLSKHLSLQSRSPSPSATLRPTASLPQPTQPDMPILRSRLLPMDEVLERVRERSLGPQETSTAEPSQRDLSRSAPPSAAQVPGNPPAFIIRGGLQAAAQAAAELARSQESQDPLSQAGAPPLLRYGRTINPSGGLREESAKGWGVGVGVSRRAERESRPRSPECDSKESQSSLPVERPGETRKRSREGLDLGQSAETEQPSRRQTPPLKSRTTISGDNSYRIIGENYPRSFSAPDVTHNPLQSSPHAGDHATAAQATGSGGRQEANWGRRSAPAAQTSLQAAMLVQPDKLLRFAEQLESIREKALLLQAEKQAVAQQAAQWQRRESHMAELVASLEQLSEEGAPVDAREELLKRGVAELSQMVLEQAPSKDQPEEGTSRGQSDAGTSS